ncbi:MAG: NFACT family protein, partial [Dialister sp.]|nr:NFACT family protein [Dialister sp.]
MQIDSASLYLFVKELQKLLIPAQVRQIHQIDNRIMDIELFCPNAKPVHMIANTHTPPVVYLTSKSKVQNQYTPSQTFCMTLRKHLEGSRLSEVRQIDMDRILAF